MMEDIFAFLLEARGFTFMVTEVRTGDEDKATFNVVATGPTETHTLEVTMRELRLVVLDTSPTTV